MNRNTRSGNNEPNPVGTEHVEILLEDLFVDDANVDEDETDADDEVSALPLSRAASLKRRARELSPSRLVAVIGLIGAIGVGWFAFGRHRANANASARAGRWLRRRWRRLA